MYNWQPIDTAPKDGTWLLLFFINGCGKPRWVIGYYTPRFTEESNNEWSEYNEEKDCYYTPEGWYENIENWDDYSSIHMYQSQQPTHWMPLPKPPEATP